MLYNCEGFLDRILLVLTEPFRIIRSASEQAVV